MSFLDACLPLGIMFVLILVFHLFRTILTEGGAGRAMMRRENPPPRNDPDPSATSPETRQEPGDQT